ncbi:hypothetical protein OF83DRAFT_1150511 [Amylostereum chailletii]|nr:hypothetical protein OF83DRAFT_1150511 [Amylostereum chailletii]
MMPDAAAHRVLSTLELLDIIFSYSDRKTNAANARVSSAWTGVARDYIWRVVDRPCQLFRLLAPITCLPNEEQHEFTRVPSHEDWERFQPFARRVHHIELSSPVSMGGCKGQFDRILEDVAYTRLDVVIFPNLRSVWIHRPSLSRRFTSLFLHPSLRKLGAVSPVGDGRFSTTAFLEDIARKAPNIEVVELSFPGLEPGGFKKLEGGLCAAIHKLSSLKQIHLPLYFFSSAVAEALSKSLLLNDIEFDRKISMGSYHDVMPFSFRPAPGCFRHLVSLSLCVPFEDLQQVFKHPNFPMHTIRCLAVRAPRSESRASVHGLTSILGARCKALTDLVLVMGTPLQALRENDLATWARHEEQEQISYETIRPVQSIGTLHLLTIQHTHVLRITDRELHFLVAPLRRLRRLILNASPQCRTFAPGITLRSLGILAKHCPAIQDIALCVDARLPAVQDHPGPSSFKLSAIRRLQLSGSLIEEASRANVVLFLNRVVSHAAHGVHFGNFDSASCFDCARPASVAAREASWQWVVNNFDLVKRARQEGMDEAYFEGRKTGEMATLKTASVVKG